jgi:hypothetical protein
LQEAPTSPRSSTSSWLWTLRLNNNSIDSWERLKKVFINNFQGAITRAGTRHDLAQCKQERNELLRSYTRRFFDVRATIVNISEEDIIDCFYNGITNLGIYRDFGRNRPKTVVGLHDMMHDWSEQEERTREWFPRHNDINLRRSNDNHTESTSQMTSSRLWIVLREAGRQRCRRSSKSSCRRNARGILVPIMRQLIATTSGGHSTIKRTSQRTKNLKRMTKGTNLTMRSFKMLRKPSMSSSEVMTSSIPGGNRNCFSEKSCPSSRRYHDHSGGRRSPSRSHVMINGQASQSPANSPWSWTRWWQKSSSPEFSSTAEVVSTSSSPAL